MDASFRFPSLVSMVVLAVVVSAVGCSARDTMPARALPAPLASRAVVWTEDLHGEGEHSFFLDAEGRVLEERRGVALYDGANLVTVERREESVATNDCGDTGGSQLGAPAPGVGATTALFLTTDGGDEVRVLPAPRPERSVQAFQSVIELTGSAGPFLFLRQTTYVLTCGGVGSSTAEAFVWDIAHRKMVSRGALFPDDAALDGRAERALAADADEGERDARGERTFTELLPVLSRDGGLSVSVRFVLPATYASTRGGWSSFTRSVFVPAKTLPAALGAHAAAPEPVRTFVRAQLAPVRGYSTRP